MTIYFIMILVIIFQAYIFRKDKKKFCIMTGITLWLLIALRSIKIGLADTEKVYLPFFNMVQEMNFLEIMNYKWMSDKMFFIIMKIISLFTSNYQVCIAILGIPYIALVMTYTYKESKQPLFSTIIFISLYYLYSFFLLRQVIAIGIVLFSVKYIKQREPIKFVLMVLMASLFHKTALIFCVAYPFCRYIKFGKKNYIMILLTLIIAKNFSSIILNILPYFDFTGRIASGIASNLYSTNSPVSMFGLFITVIMLIASNLYYKEMWLESPNNNVLYNLSTIGSIVFALSSIVAEFYRASLYFSIFNIILLSNSIACEQDKQRKIIYNVVICSVFVLYFFLRTINNTGSNPYVFYWG